MKWRYSFDIPDSCIGDIFNYSFGIFSINSRATVLLKKIQKQWSKFVTEDKEYKKLYSIPYERGWMERRGEKKAGGNSYDIKEFFHFHRDYKKRLKHKGVDYSRYNSFFDSLEELYKLCWSATLALAHKIDRRLPGKCISQKIRRDKNHVIRLLYYPEQPLLDSVSEEKVALAKAHFDRDFLTFALLETLPGLCLGLELEEEYRYEEGKVLCFTGGKFDYVTGKNVKMIRHGVKNLKAGARISVIFFSHIPLSRDITQRYIEKREEEMNL